MIYQSSDLNQRCRAVLDAAREGLVRVWDKDGVSLVMAREERFEELERRDAIGDGIAHATELGDWTWARYLPTGDLDEFVTEVRDALYRACREFSLEPLNQTLDAWRETANMLGESTSGDGCR